MVFQDDISLKVAERSRRVIGLFGAIYCFEVKFKENDVNLRFNIVYNFSVLKIQISC